MSSYDLLLVLLFLFSVGAIALISLFVEPRNDECVRQKRFDRVIAEDVRMRQHGLYGIDLITCANCHLEKRKLGMITLGGLNTLVLEDLNIVLPPRDGSEEDSSEGAYDERSSALEIVNRLGLSDRIAQMGVARVKFSGLKIKNLSLATLSAETNVCPRFVATSGEARKDGLHLTGCTVVENGRTNVIGRAILTVVPEIKLVWSSGEIELVN